MRNKKLTIDLIRDIMVKELELDDERVNMYNQKFIIPPVDGLFVIIQYKGTPKVLSSRNSFKDEEGVFKEIQDVNTLEDIAISLFSKNLEALQRKEEAVMALYSIYSQQVQEENSFKIFRNPKLADLSFLEGAAILNRADIDIQVLAWYQKVKEAAYINPKDVYVTVNDGLPNMTREIDVSEQ